MTYFDERAATTSEMLERFKLALDRHLGDDRARIIGDDTCIYVVGSGARGELSVASDIDLFVTRCSRVPSDMDAFHVRQAITRALFDDGRKEPSQGGEFLKMHTGEGLCASMGTRTDDSANTFTARMLLLLESRVLLGEVAYDELLKTVVSAYWKNTNDHQTDYQPFVLVNDIVRYWRILLLNYVAKNTEKERELQPHAADPERRRRSYKLRFSRCMTCFSALAALLVATDTGCVEKGHVLMLAKESPVQRLLRVGEWSNEAQRHVKTLLALYEGFLKTLAEPDELIASLADERFKKARAEEGQRFGDEMFDLLQELGKNGRGKTLFRHMVV